MIADLDRGNNAWECRARAHRLRHQTPVEYLLRLQIHIDGNGGERTRQLFNALARADGRIDEAAKTVSEMTNSIKENYPDPNDRASLESDRNFELRIRDRERKLILKMHEAIKRIDDRVFGICDVCGGLISEKRLMARPVTTSCIDCKMKQEKMEKLKGEYPPLPRCCSELRRCRLPIPPRYPIPWRKVEGFF